MPYHTNVVKNSHSIDSALPIDHDSTPRIMKLRDQEPKVPKRNDSRIILHFDYDCFYAAVFEKENPVLKFVPLAVQQKQIIVTCNYNARRQGLRKLQLVTEAKKICPDVVIVLGEELGRFRDASKSLYDFIRSFSWNGKVERLGFDEVFLDVTDIIEFNMSLLNIRELKSSFFQLNRQDPTVGFVYDVTSLAGHQFPPSLESQSPIDISESCETTLLERLILGSHLAQHIRFRLESETGYTSTVGISTSKLLSKLVGRLNKPSGQTTLMPPYEIPLKFSKSGQSNVTRLIEYLDIGEIPGIGFKTSQCIRNHILSRSAGFETGLIYGGTRESVSVRDIRLYPRMSSELLENILGRSVSLRGVGSKVWGLINGIDKGVVQQAKDIPTQISVENTYLQLDTLQDAYRELCLLTTNLLNRMHVDLLENDEDSETDAKRRWLAIPKTIRLSTRVRTSPKTEGDRSRSFNRISKSCPLPKIAFNLRDNKEFIVEKLVRETLVPLFKKLHSSSQGWNLCLLNVCVTNMTEVANRDGKSGKDIYQMFRQHEPVLKEPKDQDGRKLSSNEPNHDIATTELNMLSEVNDTIYDNPVFRSSASTDYNTSLDESEDEIDFRETCNICGALMPAFAMIAHERFHCEE